MNYKCVKINPNLKPPTDLIKYCPKEWNKWVEANPDFFSYRIIVDKIKKTKLSKKLEKRK